MLKAQYSGIMSALLRIQTLHKCRHWVRGRVYPGVLRLIDSAQPHTSMMGNYAEIESASQETAVVQDWVSILGYLSAGRGDICLQFFNCFFFYVHRCLACVSVCTPCTCSAQGCQTGIMTPASVVTDSCEPL